MKDVNIIIGRFQPITEGGHIKCIEVVYKEKNLPTVICIIDTIKQDAKHPFLTIDLWGAYKKLTSRKEIEDIILVKSADIVKIIDACEKKGYKVVSWVCGTDRVEDYKKMCEKYAPDVEVFEVKRGDEDVSATKVRKAIADGDEETFKKMCPKEIHSLYKKLKESLEKV